MVGERTRAEKQAIDRDPANKCEMGCGNTARLGERFCGLHMPARFICIHCGEENDDGMPCACREQRVTAHGKEVCLDGRHLADCRDEEAAQAIAFALNYAGLRSDQLPEGARLTLETFLA